MQKAQLFSIDKQQKTDAWLNDTAPLPVMPTAKLSTDFTEQVCHEIARYTAFIDDVPSAIRVNPCTIFELPSNRWEAFPFFYEGRIVGITIIADQTVPHDEIVCEGGDQTLIAMKRVEKEQND